jgi:hypothetical protein
MGPAATEELRDVVYDAGETVAALVKHNAPKNTGELKDHIAHKEANDGLTTLVGVGAEHAKIKSGFNDVKLTYKQDGNLNKTSVRNLNVRWQMYKALWHEFGTKGAPERNIPPQKASHFHQRAYDMAAPGIRTRAQKALTNVIRKASRG